MCASRRLAVKQSKEYIIFMIVAFDWCSRFLHSVKINIGPREPLQVHGS